MFGWFKKKEETPQEPMQPARSAAFQAFAAQFQPEELDVLAVTGASGFSGAKAGKEEFWTASMPLTAWMEEDSPDIRRGEFQLTTLCDDRLLEYLRTRTPRDFIIRFRARASEDGKSLLLLNIPEPGFDPDLKAILEEQKKPVSFWAEGLGTFTLNRQVDWFEAEVDWLGHKVSLSFDREERGEMEKAQQTARALLEGAEDWDRRVREYAAGQLLELANDWAENTGEEDSEPEAVTREQFMARMELEAVQVEPDGGFEFWFGDGEMFYGHSIHVTGSLTAGPDRAQMEG